MKMATFVLALSCNKLNLLWGHRLPQFWYWLSLRHLESWQRWFNSTDSFKWETRMEIGVSGSWAQPFQMSVIIIYWDLFIFKFWFWFVVPFVLIKILQKTWESCITAYVMLTKPKSIWYFGRLQERANITTQAQSFL